MSGSIQPGRLAALDGLRGLFAIMVVLLHTPVNFHFMTDPIIRNGHIAVEFFFVLSGFVIAMNYGARIGSPAAFGRFLILRIGRIWPLHAFVLLLFLLTFALQYMALGTGPLDPGSAELYPRFWTWVGLEALLLSAFANDSVWFLNFPSWSINAEVWAYLLFGLLVLGAGGRRHLGALGVAAVILGCGAVVFGGVRPGFGGAWDFSLFRASFFFFVGVVTFAVWKAGVLQRQLTGTAPEIVLALLFLACLLFLRRFENYFLPLALLFPLAVLVIANEGGAISAALKRPLLQHLGMLSFTLYISHLYFIRFSTIVLEKAGGALGVQLFETVEVAGEQSEVLSFGSKWLMDAYVVALLAGIIWVCGLLYRLVERPAQQAFARLAFRLFPQERLAPTPG